MLSIDAGALQICLTDNQNLPKEGPRVIPAQLDFSANDTVGLDLSNQQQRGFFSMLQTIFVDMGAAAAPLTITVNGTGQTIICKQNTQGYYNILQPNPIKLTFTSVAGSVPKVPVFLCNMPIAGAVWSTV
jgi:hypothetical protein